MFRVGQKVRVKMYDQWPYKYATNGATIKEEYQGKIFVIKATGMTGDGGQYGYHKKHRWYKFTDTQKGVFFTDDHLEMVEDEFFDKDLFQL